MQAFIVCSAAAVIYLVCRCIISCCSHDEDDEEDDLGLTLPYLRYLESSSHNESYIPESYARGAESEHGHKTRISPQDKEALVTALANKVLADEGSNVTAEDIRSRARTLKSKLLKALKQGSRANKKGDYVAVSRYKLDIQELKRKVEFLDRVAAKVIFTEKNKRRPDGMVDLHGLYVEEALEYAKEAFQSATPRDDKVVRFIVGKGLHAKDGKAKIRPALEKLCEERGFTHHLDPKNAGVLVVQR